jgi:hypothetical protein
LIAWADVVGSPGERYETLQPDDPRAPVRKTMIGPWPIEGRSRNRASLLS